MVGQHVTPPAPKLELVTPDTIGMGFRVPGLGVIRLDFTDLAASKSDSGSEDDPAV